MLSTTKKLGFNLPQESQFWNYRPEIAIRQDSSRTTKETTLDYNTSFYGRWLPPVIKKAITSYLVDGLVRQTVDKYCETHKDFRLIGEKRAVTYLESRLNEITLLTGEHWKTIINRAYHEYIKTGNAILLKYRGENLTSASRPVYQNRPYTLSSLYLVSMSRLQPVYGVDQTFVGWKFEAPITEPEKFSLVAKGARLLPVDKARVVKQIPEHTEPYVLIPGLDILHIMYVRPADSLWGVGPIVAGLEDIALLRNLEQSLAIMIRKNSSPLVHHTISRPLNPGQGIQDDINYALSLHKRSGPDSVFVTGDNHQIEVHGSESQALRLEGYLKYFSARALAAMGTNPYLMGMETVTLGAAEGANKLFLSKSKKAQEDFARAIESLLFAELLWEGGFDPYQKQKDLVKLDFIDADPSERIKQESHYADMWTKNFITQEYGLLASNIYDPQPEKKLFVHKVAIPLAKAKPAAPASSTSKKRETVEQAVQLIPEKPEHVEDFLLLLEARTDFRPRNFEEFVGQITDLLGHPEAIVMLIQQELDKQEGDDGR